MNLILFPILFFLVLSNIKQILAVTCPQGFYQCMSAGFSTKCCPCDADGDIQSFTCSICPPMNGQCDFVPDTKLKCRSGTELMPSNKCYFPEVCDNFYCCCQCKAGYYNPDDSGDGTCLSCPMNTVSPQKSSTCYDTCSFGTGLDGYGKNEYPPSDVVYYDTPKDISNSNGDSGDTDSSSSSGTAGIGIDGDLGSSSSASSDMNGIGTLPSYRASANGTQCLNCIPGSFNAGNSFFCSDCPLPYYGSDNTHCLECYPLQLSYYSLSFQSSGDGGRKNNQKNKNNAKTMLYYHPCQAVGFGLDISTIIPIIIALFILLLSPNIVLLFQRGFQLFFGMMTYTILPITTSVFNLTYVLFSFFQSIDTFQLVITFSFWPSLICLFLILFVYRAVPCFYCCKLPSSWYDEDYENITKLIPIVILFFIHLPFYIVWLMVGYFLVVSKTFVIGSISSRWFRVWVGNSRFQDIFTTGTTHNPSSSSSSIMSSSPSSSSSSTVNIKRDKSASRVNTTSLIDAELLNFLIIFQILFEFFPLLIILLNEKYIIVDNGLNGLYGLESIEVLGIHGLNGLKKMIFLCGLLSCISGIYRVLYYKIYKRIDLLDIPLSCKIWGVQLFNNNNNTSSNSSIGGGVNKYRRTADDDEDVSSSNNDRDDVDYNVLPTAAPADTNINNTTSGIEEEAQELEQPQQQSTSTEDTNHHRHHTATTTSSSIPVSFKKLLCIRLKDIGIAILAVFVYGCFWAFNIPKYIRQMRRKGRSKAKGKKSDRRSSNRNRNHYSDEYDDNDEEEDDDVELRSVSRKLKSKERAMSNNNRNNKNHSRVQRRHRRYNDDGDDDDDASDSYDDDDDLSSDDDDEGEKGHSASASLLTSYKQDMMTMKNELDSMRSEFIRLKSTNSNNNDNSNINSIRTATSVLSEQQQQEQEHEEKVYNV